MPEAPKIHRLIGTLYVLQNLLSALDAIEIHMPTDESYVTDEVACISYSLEGRNAVLVIGVDTETPHVFVEGRVSSSLELAVEFIYEQDKGWLNVPTGETLRGRGAMQMIINILDGFATKHMDADD